MSNKLLEAIKTGEFQAVIELNLTNPDKPNFIDVNAEGEYKEGLVEEEVTAIPLHVALYLNQVNTAMYLVQVGADVNKKGNFDEEPLEVYFRSGITEENLSDKIAMIKVLFRAGAEISDKLLDDRIFVCRESWCSGQKKVASLNAKVAKELYRHKVFSDFMYHVAAGDIENAKLYLENKFLLKDSRSPLNICKVGVDVNTDGGFYGIAVLEAARLESSGMLQMLYNRNARLDMVDANGFNVLHYAARHNRTDNLKWLLNTMKLKGFDIVAMLNQKDLVNGMTPIQIAQQYGQSEAASFLLNAEVQLVISEVVGQAIHAALSSEQEVEQTALTFASLSIASTESNNLDSAVVSNKSIVKNAK